MNEAQILLKKHFGYENFRPGQEKIISHILNGEDCLGIMPTGAGKSICYQIPALIFSGVTIVISPLISLMKDQVDALNEVGIPATFINSTLSNSEYSQTIENIVHNVYKIIYVAPERLNSDTFINLLNNIDISMISIDEAHCVSQWGHDFRPSYREIANVILNLKKRPIVSAFTATATQIVKDDIINLTNKNVNVDIFKLIENIICGNKEDAIESYNEMLKLGEEPIKIIVMLANQIRIIYQAKELSKKGYREKDIAQILDIHPYRVKLALTNGYKYTSSVLLKKISELAQMDIDIKKGLVDKSIALELFIVSN